MGRKKKVITEIVKEGKSIEEKINRELIEAKAGLVGLFDEETTHIRYIRYLSAELDDFKEKKMWYMFCNIFTFGLVKRFRDKENEMRRTIRLYEAEVVLNKSDLVRLEQEIKDQELLISKLEHGE